VTGGSRRIGAAIVEDLAANGFAVVIHCNTSRREADRLAERLRDQGRVGLRRSSRPHEPYGLGRVG
jgi:NAD(P)-dependent dehydrogenase (short-subunit alcohol dehydrogenase family)